MDASHAIDGMRPGNAQVCHVDALHRALLHQRHAPQSVYIPWERGRHPLCQERPELGRGPRTPVASPYPQISAHRLHQALHAPTLHPRPSPLTLRKRWLIS